MELITAFFATLTWWGWTWLVVAGVIICLTLIISAHLWLSEYEDFEKDDAQIALGALAVAPIWPALPILFMIALIVKIFATAFEKESF